MLIKNKNIVLRDIHDSFFLIDITQNYLNDICNLYEINEIGVFIWNALESANSIKEIVDLLLQNIVDDVNYDEVYDDVEMYIKLLINSSFVEEHNGRD